MKRTADRINCQRLFGKRAPIDTQILSTKTTAVKFAFIIKVDIIYIFTTTKPTVNG